MRHVDALYRAGAPDVLDVLAAHDDDVASVLVVGHEPWCSGLVELLTGARLRMAPACLVRLEVGPSWDGLDPDWCRLEWVVPPSLAASLAPAARRTPHR